MFKLHPQLEKDTLFLGDLPLSRVLLMNTRHFPWVILVPRLVEAKELTDISGIDRSLLMEEIAAVMGHLQLFLKPDKMNMAALGNQVPQLHVHIIARFNTDRAWPNPVWGTPSEPYGDDRIDRVVMDFRRALYLLAQN